MDDETKTEDVKQEENSEDSSTPENTSSVTEDVKKTEEEAAKGTDSTKQFVDEILADGTKTSKEVKVPYDKFKTLNEQSKLLGELAPFIERLKSHPDSQKIIDDVMKGDTRDDIESRMARIEADIQSKKRTEMEETITQAVSLWPDFKDSWPKMRPLVEGLEKGGTPYREAVQRSYFAVNPEAVKKNERLLAIQQENTRGVFTTGGGVAARTVHEEAPVKDAYQLTESDKEFLNTEFAKNMGLTPALYQKHSGYLKKLSAQLGE